MIFRRIPIARRTKPYFLILGGWGHGNFGDEALLNVTLNDLSRRFPDYELVVLSPNPAYTVKLHSCAVELAPRESFFEHTAKTYYWLGSFMAKLQFVFKMIQVCLSVIFDVCKIPLCLIGDEGFKLLSLIKGASLIYFAGGGYLTGKTRPRLWDGCLFIILSKWYNKPVVLSGQMIGLFCGWFDRWLARKAFSQADLITLRDAHQSFDALADIGVGSSRISTAFDDAVFCETANDDGTARRLLHQAGMSDELIGQGYVMLQFHYWGIPDAAAKMMILDSIVKLVTFILGETPYSVLLFAMHETDLLPLRELMAVKADPKLFSLGHCEDFKNLKAVIAQCTLCISMKHHPLIFALSEKKPVLSLAYSPYYEHKNGGAAAVVGLDKYNIAVTGGFDMGLIESTFLEAIQERSLIETTLAGKLGEFKTKRARFLSDVANIVSEYSAR